MLDAVVGQNYRFGNSNLLATKRQRQARACIFLLLYHSTLLQRTSPTTYCLKQSPRAWLAVGESILTGLNFALAECDQEFNLLLSSPSVKAESLSMRWRDHATTLPTRQRQRQHIQAWCARNEVSCNLDSFQYPIEQKKHIKKKKRKKGRRRKEEAATCRRKDAVRPVRPVSWRGEERDIGLPFFSDWNATIHHGLSDDFCLE